MGRYDKLFNPEPTLEQHASLLANSRTSKPTNQQTGKSVNQQASKEVNQQTSELTNQQTRELVNQQTSSSPLSTKEKKKYGTYLREDSIVDIHIRAAQDRKKDHELLQEIVDFYFKNTKS